MTTQPRDRGRGRTGHVERLYVRIDDLTNRVARLERAMWISAGALGSVATFNLISNLTGG